MSKQIQIAGRTSWAFLRLGHFYHARSQNRRGRESRKRIAVSSVGITGSMQLVVPMDRSGWRGAKTTQCLGVSTSRFTLQICPTFHGLRAQSLKLPCTLPTLHPFSSRDFLTVSTFFSLPNMSGTLTEIQGPNFSQISWLAFVTQALQAAKSHESDAPFL